MRQGNGSAFEYAFGVLIYTYIYCRPSHNPTP